jgi:hypothetical protein
MFGYDPLATLTAIAAPIVALVAGDDESQSRELALAVASDRRVASGWEPIASASFGHVGHNLMRYRPQEVCAAIMAIARYDTV